MHILSPHIDLADTVSIRRQRAERLLSPTVVQLDARAIKARSAEPVTSTTNVYGSVLFAFVVSAMLVAKWVFLPGIYPTMETKTAVQTPLAKPLPAALGVSDVELRKISVNGQKTALVVGHIINRSGNKLPIPQLNIVLHQKDGQEVTSWRYRSQQASLKAGASLRFTSKYNFDVKDGSVVEIQFVSRNDR